MGYAKYTEDIQEAISETEFERFGNYIQKSKEPPIYNCAYCNCSFYTKKDLYSHIKNTHNVVSSILIVNGKIIHQNSYIKKLNSLLIVRYDTSEKIYINDKIFTNVLLKNEINITEEAKNVLDRYGIVKITIGENTYYLKHIIQEEIDINKINLVIEKWNTVTALGKHIQYVENYKNELEKKCFDGLYNYFIACVSSGKDKENRYGDAFAIMTEVVNILPVARILLKIIAFNFNWVDTLRMLNTNDDVFSTVYDFMMNKKSDKIYSKFNGNMNIFIEDEIEETIKAIIDFQSNNDEQLNKYLEGKTLRSICSISDINLRDKLLLIIAKQSIRQDKMHDARRFYNEIQTPFFNKEINDFIKNL